MKKVFIVGSSRSGTTMLARVLSANRQIHGFNELHYYDQLRQQNAIDHDSAIKLFARLISRQRDGHLFERVLPAYIEEAKGNLSMRTKDWVPDDVYCKFLEFETLLNNATIACEQTPAYLSFSEEILKAVRGAKIINIIRDPRAVMSSRKSMWKIATLFDNTKRRPFTDRLRTWANYHSILSSQMWVVAARRARHLSSHECFMNVRFEDLVEKPEEHLTKICEWIGIELDKEMLLPRQEWSSSSGYREKKGFDKTRTETWRERLTNSEIYLCQKIAGIEMKRWGYHLQTNRKSVFGVAAQATTFFPKALLSLLLNLGRERSLIEAVRSRLYG